MGRGSGSNTKGSFNPFQGIQRIPPVIWVLELLGDTLVSIPSREFSGYRASIEPKSDGLYLFQSLPGNSADTASQYQKELHDGTCFNPFQGIQRIPLVLFRKYFHIFPRFNPFQGIQRIPRTGFGPQERFCWRFNPFQGIQRIPRHPQLDKYPSTQARVSIPSREFSGYRDWLRLSFCKKKNGFQSLPGNSADTACCHGYVQRPQRRSFNPFQGIQRIPQIRSMMAQVPGPLSFQSLPGNSADTAGDIALCACDNSLVSIPSREFSGYRGRLSPAS